MELMAWFIKPFDKFMIWLGSTVFDTTVFGIKLGYIVIYVGTIYMVFTLVDAVYDKGFDAGVESITK